MTYTLPPLEPRLQRRYQQLVSEHLNASTRVAAGLRALPGGGTAFASTQAAWRFLNNERVTLPALAAPLLEAAGQMSREACEHFALVVHDWSNLSFTAHSSKTDRLHMGAVDGRGYKLATSLLISDRDGMALSVLSQCLRSDQHLWTTYETGPRPLEPFLDELTVAMTTIEGSGLARPCVHIIDRDGDSVAHLRAWNTQGRQVLVRATAHQRVESEGRVVLLGDVCEQTDLQPGDIVELKAGVLGQQFVGETVVTLTRPARPHRQRHGKRVRRVPPVAGEPLRLRAVVSEIRGSDEVVWARWLLLTNLPETVSAERIARWYYWRWKIESYFKLLKGAGHHAEQWQQQTPEAIARRVLVASMASVVVWQIARAESAEAEATRQLLVRLSGRQMRRDRPASEPALLSGIWVLLAMLDTLEHYDLDELKKAARALLPGFSRYDKPPGKGDV